MTYWILQAIAALALFSIQFAFAHEREFSIYPEWVVLTSIICNSALLVLLSHFIIRAPQKYLQKDKAYKKQIFFTLVVTALAAAFIDTTIASMIDATIKESLNGQVYQFRNGSEFTQELNVLGLHKETWDMSRLIVIPLMMFALYFLWGLFYLCLTSLRNRLQIKQKVKEGQLALLMSQLNPHFLFNSMNSIRGMIFENKEIAKELVDKLTELFRYNLSSKQQPTISLKEELKVCEFYLDIEHTRLEERLLIEINVPDELYHYSIPTMGVLTLLENAIKHGIAPRIEQSLLRITATEQDKTWQLDVSNPLYLGEFKASGTGTGLSNLKQRMTLMYQDEASITTKEVDNHFIASLILPKKKH
ncbi:sensor histidine kinase [Pseudoalteromonas ulvae]|uniref:Signal transduction histidine kinase internal region domain-containing protein n=1 Tax=Pseudoalteromonas ulvae TaxID=107327 RepID=A0A244CUK3_PSEDV|nr:histidine kinase [Pseudoalteromonas ulvae]OUL59126.1 hypothetical protein B1199_02280 [Pseudoalteromonas ulvae]